MNRDSVYLRHIHNYMGVDRPAVWEITQQYVPALKGDVTRILGDLTKDT